MTTQFRYRGSMITARRREYPAIEFRFDDEQASMQVLLEDNDWLKCENPVDLVSHAKKAVDYFLGDVAVA